MRQTIKEKILDFRNSIEEGILDFRYSLLVRFVLDCKSVNDLRFELQMWLIEKAMAAAPHDLRGEWMKYSVDTHYLQRSCIRRDLIKPPLSEKELTGLISSFPKW